MNQEFKKLELFLKLLELECSKREKTIIKKFIEKVKKKEEWIELLIDLLSKSHIWSHLGFSEKKKLIFFISKKGKRNKKQAEKVRKELKEKWKNKLKFPERLTEEEREYFKEWLSSLGIIEKNLWIVRE